MVSFRSITDTGYKDWKKEQEEIKKKGHTPSSGARNPIQYSNPTYRGRSEEDNYKWETEALKSVKGKGRSYNDKFNNLMKDAGISETEAREFRRWLDAQEDMAREVRRNKDGSISKNQTIHLGQDRMTTNITRMDDMLNKMFQTGANTAKQRQQTETQKRNTQAKANETERDGLLGFLDRTAGRFSNSAVDSIMSVIDPNFTEKQNENYTRHAQNKLNSNDITKMQEAVPLQQRLNTTTREAEGFLEKGADIAGMVTGEAAKYVPAYRGANAIMKGLGVGASGTAPKLATDLARGALAGGLVGTSRAFSNERADEDFGAMDWAKTIGLEAILAGGGDAAIGALIRSFPQAGEAIREMARGGMSEQQMAKELAKMMGGRQGNPNANPFNVLADPSPNIPTDFLNAPRQAAQQNVDDLFRSFTTDSVPQVDNVLEEAVRPNPILEDDWLNFGTSQRVQPRRMTEPVQTNALADPMGRPQEYWQGRYEEFTNTINQNYDTNNLTPEALEDLWSQFARYDEPVRLDQVVDLAYPKGFEVPQPPAPAQPSLKEMLDADPRIRAGIQNLTPQPSLNQVTGMPNADFSVLDDLVPSQQQQQSQPLSELISQVSGGSQDDVLKQIDDVINGLQSPKANVPVRPNQSVDELINTYRQQEPPTTGRPKDFEQQSMVDDFEQSVDEMMGNQLPPNALRLNMQHNSGADDVAARTMFSHSMDSPSLDTFSSLSMKREMVKLKKKGQSPDEIRKALNLNEAQYNAIDKLKVKKGEALFHKGYEQVLQSMHKLDVAAKKIEGKEFKFFGEGAKEHTAVKALTNEQGVSIEAKSIFDEHFQPVVKELADNDIQLKDAFEYLMAKNWNWFKNQGNHPDYTLPAGYTEHDLLEIIGRVDNTNTNPAKKQAYENFISSIRRMMDKRREYMLKSGNINADELKALSENPYYFPTVKDKDWGLDNIDLARKNNKRANTGSSEDDVFALGEGDLNYLDNPIDTLVSSVYGSVRSFRRNQTFTELYKLATNHKDNPFIKEAANKSSDTLVGMVNGEEKYLDLSPDLREVIKEVRAPEQAENFIRSTISLYAGAKTRSFEYLAKALTREWQTGYINSATLNPAQHFKDVINGFKASSSKELHQAGGAFQHAYKDGMSSYNETQTLAKQVAKEVRGEVIDKNVAQKAGDLAKKLWNLPARAGNKIDDSVRSAELQRVDREFLPKIQELQQRISQLEAQPTSGNPNQGFNTQAMDGVSELDNLRNQLRELQNTYDIERTYQARDMMNYKRHGKSWLAKFIKNYVAFANTTSQGKDRMFRAFRERPMQTTLKIATPALGMMTLQEAAYRYSSTEDQKIYDDTHDFIKNTMHVFVINGTRIMIPKPFEAALLMAPLEHALNSTHKFDEEGIDEKADKLAMTYVKELLPLQTGKLFAPWLMGSDTGTPMSEAPANPAIPFVESWANKKTSNQKPIGFDNAFTLDTNEGGVFIPDGMTQDEVASDFASLGSRALGGDTVNADHLDYLIKSVAGDYGKYGLNAVDMLMSDFNKQKSQKFTNSINPFQDYIHSNSNNDLMNWLFQEAYIDRNKVPKEDE